jgi:hypothetical protein
MAPNLAPSQHKDDEAEHLDELVEGSMEKEPQNLNLIVCKSKLYRQIKYTGLFMPSYPSHRRRR